MVKNDFEDFSQVVRCVVLEQHLFMKLNQTGAHQKLRRAKKEGTQQCHIPSLYKIAAGTDPLLSNYVR